MDMLVAIDSDDRGQHRNHKNAHLPGNSSSDQRSNQLTTHDHVDRRPTSTCYDIEEGHNTRTAPTKRETRNGHLPQTKFGPHRREESNRKATKHIEDDDC